MGGWKVVCGVPVCVEVSFNPVNNSIPIASSRRRPAPPATDQGAGAGNACAAVPQPPHQR